MVPSIYLLICDALFVSLPSPGVPSSLKVLNPHFEATVNFVSLLILGTSSNELILTEYFITEIVLPEEISNELLVHAGMINDLHCRKDRFLLVKLLLLFNRPSHLQQCPKRCNQAQWPSREQAQLLQGYNCTQNRD